jgi:anti-sigma-K factor RskA
MNDHLRTQAALYALDALPSEERAEFLKAVAADPVLALEVAEMRDAAAMIAFAAPLVEPPSGLKDRVLARIAAETPVGPPAAVVQEASSGPGLASLIPWAMAAGFAIFAGVLWNGNQRLESTARELANQRQVAAGLYDQVASLERQLSERGEALTKLRATVADLEERNRLAGIQVATLTSKLDASYLASLVWDKDSQEGILNVRRLPNSGEGKDYQLWVIDPKLSAPVSAGVFQVNEDGSATVKFAPIQPVTDATTFAVTLERTGGVPKAEGPVVLAN